jgi:hypothetical protein
LEKSFEHRRQFDLEESLFNADSKCI